MTATILRPGEIPALTRIDPHFPTGDYHMIRTVERHEFLTCLGVAMQEELIAALVDYSNAPVWTSGSTAAGTIVLYKDAYWKALNDTMTLPSVNSEDWELAPKFSSECMNTIWCDVLGPYLSWLVIRKTVPKISVSFEAAGMVKKVGNDFQAAGSSDVKLYQVYVDQNIKELYDVLMYELIKTDCLTYRKACGCKGICRCNKKKHGYQWG